MASREKVEKVEKKYACEEDRIVATYVARIKNPITAIRAFCVSCCGGQPRSVSTCASKTCPLHPFRMGVNTMSARYGVSKPVNIKRKDKE